MAVLKHRRIILYQTRSHNNDGLSRYQHFEIVVVVPLDFELVEARVKFEKSWWLVWWYGNWWRVDYTVNIIDGQAGTRMSGKTGPGNHLYSGRAETVPLN